MKSAVTVLGLAVLCLTSLLPASAVAQSPPPLVQPLPQVRFDQFVANVKDPTGVLVGSLGAKNFIVEEDGVKQPIIGFNVAADAPMSVGILVDTNADMQPYIAYARMTVLKILISTMSARDEYALYSFPNLDPKADSDLSIRRDFGPPSAEDVTKLQDTLTKMAAKGPTTSLYNVVADAVSLMKKAKNDRRALVVLTLAQDRESGSINVLKRAAAQYGVSIYAIGFAGSIPSEDKAALARATKSINMSSFNNSSSLSALGLQDVSGGLQNRGGMGGFGRGGGYGGFGQQGFGQTGFGQTGFGQQGFGQTGFGQQQGFGQTGFGQQPYNNSTFGQPGFGQQGFGQPGFGQQGFGQPGFGQQGFGQPGFDPSQQQQQPQPPREFGFLARSKVLEDMVAAGSGKFLRFNLSIYETDAGAAENDQVPVALAGAINEALRAQYTIGYYTTKQGPLADRKLLVKTTTEGLTVSIQPPPTPEELAAAAAAAQPKKEGDKGKADDKSKKDDKSKDTAKDNTKKK